MKKTIIALPLASFMLAGCVHGQVGESRQAYILAHPHSWIELTIADSNVPPALPDKNEKDQGPTPPGCSISVDRFRENFLAETIWPRGDHPPYLVDTGFRFPVPSGSMTLTLNYTDCRLGKDGKPTTISITLPVTVSEGKVLPIRFDGATATTEPETENQGVSNEDIARLIQGLKTDTAK